MISKSLFVMVLVLIVSSSFALAHEGDAYVRVVSANPETRTYTFSCDMNPNNNYLRDFFIRKDSGSFSISLGNEAESLDRAQGDHFSYTFQDNGFYHVGCVIVNNTNFSQLFRGDVHIDLRQQLWNPEIVPLSGNGLTTQLTCNYSNSNAPVSW